MAKVKYSAFFCEDYRRLKHVTTDVDHLKRQRRKQIIALRRLDPIVSVEKSTWYFLIVNSLSQKVCTNGCNSNVYLVRSLLLLFEVVVRMRDLSKYDMLYVRKTDIAR